MSGETPEAPIELMVFALLFIVRNITEPLVAPGKRDARRPTRGQGLTSLLLLGVAHTGSGVAAAYFLYRWGPPLGLIYLAGLALFVAGYLGRIACLRQLGQAYSRSFEPDPGGRLVTTGIYSAVRHPLYAFYLLELIAFLLIRPNLISAAGLILASWATLYRIRGEESRLAERFGERYLQYRQTTKALIPGIL